jgi:hypothetical protein
MKPTISEGLGWLKTLAIRHAELVKMRDANAKTTTQDYNGKTVITVPEYDVKKLDKRVTILAREHRLCAEAIKKTNATTPIDYVIDDTVLGELEV